MSSEEKKQLRTTYKAMRREQDPLARIEGSKKICLALQQLPIVSRGKRIFVYLSMPIEPSLDLFIEWALGQGKEVYVPLCAKETGIMEAVRLSNLQDVEEGLLGIRIPKAIKGGYTAVEPNLIDVVLTPGVVFDAFGGRLGMGAGYYDRFLKDISEESRIGVCWDFQMRQESVPMDDYYQCVGLVVTDKQTYKTIPKG